MYVYVKGFSEGLKDKGFSESHCSIFHCIVEELFQLQQETGISKYDFDDEGTSITNPFYESSGRFDVNPIEEYGNKFLESDFIKLLEKIKSDLGDNLTLSNMNLCAAKNIAEIQSYVIEEFSKFFKKPIDCCIEEFEDSLFFIEVDNKKIIDPFKDGQLIKEYEKAFFESKFSKLLA